MNRFIHIGFAFPGVPKVLDIEPRINSISQDWVRYAPNNWILWTDRSPAEVYAAIERGIDAEDQVLIVAIDFNWCFGKIAPWIWTWIEAKGYRVQDGRILLEKALPPP